jgi:hypothetical protein
MHLLYIVVVPPQHDDLGEEKGSSSKYDFLFNDHEQAFRIAHSLKSKQSDAGLALTL